jgi:hypothetical protein
VNVAGNNDDGVWMTYAQLAASRGVKRIAAVRIVQRHKWRKQAGNDGQVRVLVPHDMTGPSPRLPQHVAGYVTGDVTATPVTVTSEVETVLAALREAHAGEIERLNTRLDALIAGHRGEIVAIEAKLAAAEARAAEVEQLRAAIETEHTHGADLEARIAGLHGLLADAEHRLVDAERGRTTALEQLDTMDRAETARRGKGRWARLRAAWRGE